MLLAGEAVVRLTWNDAPVLVGEDGKQLPRLHGIMALARPNTRGEYKGVLHRTNSRGLRGPDYTANPAEHVFRMAVTGDSFTMGSGVAERQTYSARLEDLLNRQGGRRFEVLNAGIGGINTTVAVRRLRHVFDWYHPHLAIYGFTVNDIEGPHYRRTRDPNNEGRSFWIRMNAAGSPSYLWRFIAPRIAIAYATYINPRLDYSDDEYLDNYLRNPAAWADFQAGLTSLAQLARRRGVCAHVFVHTQLVRLDASHPYLKVYELVEQAARKLGLTVTQSFPAFEGMNARSLWVNLMDPHPNKRGHGILARALRDGLREIPPSCWKTGTGNDQGG